MKNFLLDPIVKKQEQENAVLPSSTNLDSNILITDGSDIHDKADISASNANNQQQSVSRSCHELGMKRKVYYNLSEMSTQTS